MINIFQTKVACTHRNNLEYIKGNKAQNKPTLVKRCLVSGKKPRVNFRRQVNMTTRLAFSITCLDKFFGKILFWFNTKFSKPGGASSEAWIRVYMIAPVKKFGRARLSTNFLINKHGGDFMWKRVCADSQTIWLFDVQTSQEGFGRFFTWSLVIKRDHGCKFCSEKRKYYNQRLANSGEDQYLDLTHSSQG